MKLLLLFLISSAFARGPYTVSDPDLERPRANATPAQTAPQAPNTNPPSTAPRVLDDSVTADVVKVGETCPTQPTWGPMLPISGTDYNRLVAAYPKALLVQPQSQVVCLSPEGLAAVICDPKVDKQTSFTIPNSFAQQFGLGTQLSVRVGGSHKGPLPPEVQDLLATTQQQHANKPVTVTPAQIVAAFGGTCATP